MFRTVLPALVLFAGFVQAEPPAPVGGKIAEFQGLDSSGMPWMFYEQTREAKATVVLFLGTGCPVSNAYTPRIKELHKKYSKEGVSFVGIFSLPTDEPADVAEFGKKQEMPFPLLKDVGTTLADKFQIERIPTAFVLDGGRIVRYKGRIDDQFAPGVQRPLAGTRELAQAIAAVLAGKDVAEPFTIAAGCVLTRDIRTAKTSTITYHKDVSRIIQAKCQDCHRPGEAAPFSLLTYKQAKGWSGMIRETVSEGTMPPWHAEGPVGHFRNDRRLTSDQKKTLLEWIEAGCPEGNPADAPEPKKFVTGWRLGQEPDLVLKMSKPVDVPASYLWGFGGMPYQYVPVGKPFAEDKWIQAVEVRPEFRAVIHHIIAYLIPEGKTMYDVAGPEFGRYMLAAYVPGDEAVIFPQGMAKRIPKGSQILFEVHYTPNGTAGRDQSAIGFVFAKKKPDVVAETDAIFYEKFAIPPGEANHQVNAIRQVHEPISLLALTPHMHLRGKAFKYELIHPDGKRELLLNVPKYDFNWQVSYHFKEPFKVPVGCRIECTAVYDNSTGNPFNPDPKKKVRWGEQTWEEMMIGFVEYAVTK